MTPDITIKLHVHKQYPDDNIRHYKLHKDLHSSTSGLYSKGNFPTLLKTIAQRKIYFVDADSSPHVQLNKYVVSHKGTEFPTVRDVEEAETHLVTDLLGKEVLFKGKLVGDEEAAVRENIVEAIPIKAFVEDRTFGDNKYLRFFTVDERGFLNEHGSLRDSDIDPYLALIATINKEKAWLHVNSIVGGGPATLLVAMRDIIENAEKSTLDDFKAKYKDLFKAPKPTDKNAAVKVYRAKFLEQFYAFAKRPDKAIKWSEWKKPAQESKEEKKS